MSELFTYHGERYPSYLRDGNAMQFIEPVAKQFCIGLGLDIGCGKWPLPGSVPIDLSRGGSAEELPEGQWDYVFSSHCLEHLNDPVSALEHWQTRIKSGGVLMIYLPHPDMSYWRPQFCRKHRHLFWPKDTATMLYDLGFKDVIHSERDMAWSFCALGYKP